MARLPRLGAWLLVLVLACAGYAPARAQTPLTLAVGGATASWRPQVRVQGMLDDEGLRDALSSGLPLRFQFRVELWEKGVFDRLAGTHRAALAVLQDPLDGGYTLGNGRAERRFATLTEIEGGLEAAFASTLHPSRQGRYYYIAVLEVETLSLSDLEELQRWLRGEAQPAVAGRRSVGRAVQSGLQRAVSRIIGLPTRRYEVRSPIFSPR
ncbi:MAG: hypothetical protein JO040_02075 [Gemmatimonadetes bacterium]|nr:hypothetical protein [Gemmatimonadota bacterium]